MKYIKKHISFSSLEGRIVLLFFIIVSFRFFAQQQAFEVHAPHHFSVEFLNGVNQMKVTNATGPEKMKPALAFHHGIQFAYKYQLSDKFTTRFGFGLHTQNTPIKLEPSENLNKTSLTITGRHNSIYNFFRRFDFSTAYQIKQNKHSSVKLFGGVGFNHFGSYFFQSGLKFPESPSYFFFEVLNRARPYLHVGVENEFSLKNRDFLALKLNYQFGFTSFLEGEYEFVNDNFGLSRGNFNNYLRGFNIGIEYIFSQQKKQQRIYNVEEKNQISREDARKIDRRERRFVNPKSFFLKIDFGVGSVVNRTMNKNSPYLTTGFNFPVLFPHVSIEKGIKNGFFQDFDYFFMKHRSISKVKNGLGSWGYYPFYGHYLTTGFGYRVKLQSNFKLFNIHAGLGIGAQFSKKDTLGTSYYEQFVSDGVTETITFSSTEEIKRIGYLMPIFYFGLSKDFRLTNYLAISLNYKRQFGFVPVQVIDATYTSLENPTPQKARVQIDGSAMLFSIGIKAKLDKL